ncbi:ribonucleoside-diphosphate reductase small subunit [Eptesicus fuscus gammaherpesvirus]|uniref:ribonucleoside-diphosphate reductase n=1 Tax=vespertilionid gammaherpesvirus 3 TaxID=2846598 RepID=A0A2D0ZXD3_9GAMA|nr:ribonucleoside-diphosphate reductase small subunit [Eptesicus fuscus gammaherpesvirus]ATA58291.1 ribonucleoside-diphosphate reductase small subunit [Eptesicus fuscus gammaherpesvirus]WAH70911.1 ribonucleoside-diphosphate reductase small subunit [Eptesicus fuscus gammaherpesvirus]
MDPFLRTAAPRLISSTGFSKSSPSRRAPPMSGAHTASVGSLEAPETPGAVAEASCAPDDKIANDIGCVRRFLYQCDHQGFLELTQETWQNRWFPNQICLQGDVASLAQLNDRDLEFYRFLFTFLGMAERLVNFNIDDLIPLFKSHDVEHYYTEQEAMENIHGRVYANILNMFFKNNPATALDYAYDIVRDPALRRKLNWLHGRVRATTNRGQKVLLFLVIEGMFFVSSFYVIGLLRVRGLFPGVCLANDYISRDEQLHTRAAAMLFNTLVLAKHRPSAAWIQDLLREAVDVEMQFIQAKGKGVTLVNFTDIRNFLQATADRILREISVPPIYGTTPPAECPLAYTGCIKSTNFFERESSDYSTFVANDL